MAVRGGASSWIRPHLPQRDRRYATCGGAYAKFHDGLELVEGNINITLDLHIWLMKKQLLLCPIESIVGPEKLPL